MLPASCPYRQNSQFLRTTVHGARVHQFQLLSSLRRPCNSLLRCASCAMSCQLCSLGRALVVLMGDSKLLSWLLLLYGLLGIVSVVRAADGEADALLQFRSCCIRGSSPALNSWRASQPVCGWAGVACDNSSRVVSLDLSAKRLDGSLPQLLFDGLPFLSNLNLSSNGFGGPIPSQVWNATRLLALDLSLNVLDGGIPSELGNATQLRVLDLSSNRLVGPIPPSLGRLPLLQVLWLVNNNLSGTIPPELGQCRGLVQLGIGVSSSGGDTINGITGTIPAALGNCSALQVLRIAGTEVGGEVPLKLTELSGLAVLQLRMNSLVGIVHPRLANLSRLMVLDLSYNDLSGSIPWELGLLENLLELRLGARSIQYVFPQSSIPVNVPNDMNGTIPSSLGWLTSLRVLGLQDTFVEGEIPSSLANCTFLQVLDVHTNRVTGAIPENLPVSLQVIYLQENRLEGPLPASLGNLTELVLLHLIFNDFVGTVPPEIALCSKMQFLSFGGASDRQSKGYLTGTIPTELGKLSEMLFFSIYPGRIGGGLPASLANWTSLSLFLIFSNDIGGTVPPEYGNFTKLETVCLDNAALEGAITHIDWSRMPSLKFFNLARNDLVGEIPESLGSLVQLEDISLNGNRMTGRIPKTLKNCTKLQWLFLQVNELTGDIAGVFDSLVPAGGGVSAITGLLLGRNNFTGILPDWLPILENLRILVVDGNELEGTMPSSIANMTTFKNPNNGNVEILLRSNLPGTIEVQIKGVYQSYYSIVSSLTVLDLSANKLTGGIPLEFGTMQGLHYLNLSSNLLTGSIPAALGGMGELNQMDLSYNNFTGAIPEELATLSKLESFNVSYNDLSGPIPKGSQFSSFTTSFYGNPGLCGEPSVVQCSPTASEDSAPRNRSSAAPVVESSQQEGPISYLGVAVGFVLAFGTSLCLVTVTRFGKVFVNELASILDAHIVARVQFLFYRRHLK